MLCKKALVNVNENFKQIAQKFIPECTDRSGLSLRKLHHHLHLKNRNPYPQKTHESHKNDTKKKERKKRNWLYEQKKNYQISLIGWKENWRGFFFFRKSFTSNRIGIEWRAESESETEYEKHIRLIPWFQFLAISNRFPHHTWPRSPILLLQTFLLLQLSLLARAWRNPNCFREEKP